MNLLESSSFLDFIKHIVNSFGLFSIPIVLLLLLLIWMLYKWFTIKTDNDINDLKKKNDELLNIILTHISKDDKFGENNKIYIDHIAQSHANKSEFHNKSFDMYLGVAGDLTHHPIFNNIDYILKVKIKSISFSSKIKKDVFLDMTSLKLEITKIEWLKFLKSIDIDTGDREIIKQKMINVIYNINSKFDDETINYQIPELIKNLIYKSSLQNDDIIITTTKSMFDSINNDNIYNLIYTLLTYYMILIETSLYHIINNINELNGELDFMTYDVKFFKY